MYVNCSPFVLRNTKHRIIAKIISILSTKRSEELLPGAIDRDLAPIFRSALLSVIKEDKDTFEYLYYRLTCEYNNCHHWGKEHPITDNIPDKDNIRAALDKEKLSEQQKLHKRLKKKGKIHKKGGY